MEKDEVQRIVLMTIRELKRSGMLKDEYTVVLKEVEPVIKEYFQKRNNKKLDFFLSEHSDDPYIDIIYLHYRDNITIDRIAECLVKDVSTIKRNKKRLIMSIYNMLEVDYEYR